MMQKFCRILRRVAVALMMMALLIAGAALWLNRYIQRPEVVAEYAGQFSRAMGTPVEIGQLSWNFEESFRAQHIKIHRQNPPDAFPLLSIPEMELRYKWGYFLQNQKILRRLRLQQPHFILKKTGQGDWGWPVRLTPQYLEDGVALMGEVQSFLVEKGNVLVEAEGGPWLQMQHVTMEARVERKSTDQRRAHGYCQLEKLILGPTMTITQWQSPMEWERGGLNFSSFSGRFLQGQISGSLNIQAQNWEWPYQLKMNVKGVDVAEMTREFWGRTNAISGKLDMKSSWIGSMAKLMETSGKGNFEINHGQIREIPFFMQLAKFFEINEWQQPDFIKIKGDFVWGNGEVQITNLAWQGVGGEIIGSVRLRFSGELQAQLRVMLEKEWSEKLPLQRLAGSTLVDGGGRQILCMVTGTFAEPIIEGTTVEIELISPLEQP